MSEGAGTCSKPVWEECRLHPVNCVHCVNRDVCQMRETFQAHPDKLKRCRLFQRREGGDVCEHTRLETV